MYLFNLCPFPVKAVGNLYSWMSIPATGNFPKEEVALLGAPHQVVDPSTIGQAEWVYRMVGRPDADPDWGAVKKIIVPADMVRRISDSHRDPKQMLATMILDGFHEYREFLFEQIGALHRSQPIKAAVTFVNCKSLEQVCEVFGIPVIHMEAGFIRAPIWKMSTFQFDFRGVNGNTEAAERFTKDRSRQGRLSPHEIADMLMGPIAKASFKTGIEGYQYEFGVPMQVEDDSNLVAFGNGLSNLDTLYIARQVFPPHLILARNHPLSLMKLNDHPNIARIDDSANSIEFVAKCKRVLTINSSVAFEALLMGRATYILGDSALSSVASNRVDRHLRGEAYGGKAIADYLDFIAFQYLIPRSLWMNKQYIDFRLSRPSEDQIRELHMNAIKSHPA